MSRALMILLMLVAHTAAANVPAEVQHAISQALEGKWVFRNFDKSKLSMEFDSTTELSDIVPGEPFQLYYISQTAFEYAEDDVPVDSLLSPGDWYVPLYVDSEFQQTVMLIGTRFGVEEKWSAGTRSLKTLVQTWEHIKQAWPESEGYHPKLVLIAEPYEHNLCFHIPEKGPRNLTIVGKLYIEFTPLPGKMNFAEVSSSKETFRSIKARISERRRHSDSLWAAKRRVNDSLANIHELATEHLWRKLEEKGNPAPYIPESAVTSWWNDMLVAADSAIVPQNISKSELLKRKTDRSEPSGKGRGLSMGENEIELDDQIIESARPLRVGAPAIDRILSVGEEPFDPSKLDIGFRVYKTDTTNMKDVYYHPSHLTQEQLDAFQSNIKEDRTPEDLLTQVILDLGLELNLPIETKKILGNIVFIVQTNALVACFDDNINFKIVDEIADLKPLKVVFKDASFKDDKDRINVEERFKRLSPETRITVL